MFDLSLDKQSIAIGVNMCHTGADNCIEFFDEFTLCLIYIMNVVILRLAYDSMLLD